MKSKYIFGSIIVGVFLALMIYLFTKSNIQYETDFTKVMAKHRVVKATGSWVKEKSYSIDKENRTFSFFMKDSKGVEMKVVCNGSVPNNFETATSIVVTGEYKNGFFQAREILTKCPSKYQDVNNKSAQI
jgi:cytochrome c-type biogenesis protein CcmE